MQKNFGKTIDFADGLCYNTIWTQKRPANIV